MDKQGLKDNLAPSTGTTWTPHRDNLVLPAQNRPRFDTRLLLTEDARQRSRQQVRQVGDRYKIGGAQVQDRLRTGRWTGRTQVGDR